MKASVLINPCTSEIRDVNLPVISENKVLIRVKVCGVCASKLHMWETGYGQRFAESAGVGGQRAGVHGIISIVKIN